MSNACPACGNNKERPNVLMCLVCWRMVPRPLQLDVLRTWKALQTRPRGGDAMEILKLGMARAEAYRKARDVAIAAARERRIKKEIRS